MSCENAGNSAARSDETQRWLKRWSTMPIQNWVLGQLRSCCPAAVSIPTSELKILLTFFSASPQWGAYWLSDLQRFFTAAAAALHIQNFKLSQHSLLLLSFFLLLRQPPLVFTPPCAVCNTFAEIFFSLTPPLTPLGTLSFLLLSKKTPHAFFSSHNFSACPEFASATSHRWHCICVTEPNS